MHQQVIVVRQGTNLEHLMSAYLVEDGTAGGPAYLEFLQDLHKTILSKRK